MKNAAFKRLRQIVIISK